MSLDVILKPSITEKSFSLAQSGQFTFFVKRTATKSVIARAVEDLFKVNVIKVRTVNKAGKTKRSGKSRISKTSSNQKKAIVTLKPGQMIKYFKLPEEKSTVKIPKLKPTAKLKPKKRGLLSALKRKEQRTQDK